MYRLRLGWLTGRIRDHGKSNRTKIRPAPQKVNLIRSGGAAGFPQDVQVEVARYRLRPFLLSFCGFVAGWGNRQVEPEKPCLHAANRARLWYPAVGTVALVSLHRIGVGAVAAYPCIGAGNCPAGHSGAGTRPSSGSGTIFRAVVPVRPCVHGPPFTGGVAAGRGCLFRTAAAKEPYCQTCHKKYSPHTFRFYSKCFALPVQLLCQRRRSTVVGSQRQR